MILLNIGNFKETYLASAMDNSQLSLEVALGTGTNMPSAPCLALITSGRSLYNLKNGEIVYITDRTGDVFTITRAYSGTTATVHATGSLVLFNLFAEHIDALNDAYTTLSKFIALAFGTLGSAVIKTTYDPTTDLQVVQDTGSNMKFKVKVGHAMVTYLPAKLDAEHTSATIVAPTGNPRIDLVQIDKDGNIEVKTGTEAGSPVAPTVDSDALELATIALTVGMTQITNGDITDVRTYY